MVCLSGRKSEKMYILPVGYIDWATGAVRDELFRNLANGGRLDDRYYYTIAAEKVWYCFVTRINEEADRGYLSARDIAWGCRRYGIRCEKDNQGDIRIQMPNFTYWFTDTCEFAYGGPVYSDGNYQGYEIDTPPMCFSTRTFIRFLKWFDPVIISIRDRIPQMLERLCLQYKQAQIAMSSLRVILEPRLEGTNARYACRAGDNGAMVDIWLFPESIDPIRFTFEFTDLVENIGLYEKIIKIVAKEPDRYESYHRWAKLVSWFGREPIPEKDGGRCIGII